MRFLSISLYQIQVFVKSAEFMSFTSAASYFNVTQSAISKSIASLEATLGYPVFLRSRSKLKLTEAGTYLFERWRALVVSAENDAVQAEQLAHRSADTLMIGVPNSLRRGNERDILNAFQAKHPDIQISYHAFPQNQLVPRLASGELHMIITGLYEAPTLDRMKLAWKNYVTLPDVVIMHRSNPLSQMEHIRIEDLKDEEFWMLFPSDNASYFERIYFLCTHHGFQPKFAPFMPNVHSILENLIRNQRGVMISNRFLTDIDHPDLRHFELDGTNAGLIIAWKAESGRRQLKMLVNAFPTCSTPELL